MVFEKKTWENNPPSSATPITAAELNRMENGIALGVLGSNGPLNEPTNLNEIRRAEHAGNWTIRKSNIINGPTVNFDLGDLDLVANVHVEYGQYSVVTQTVTFGTSRILGFYQRVSNGNDTFGAWGYFPVLEETGAKITTDPYDLMPPSKQLMVIDQSHKISTFSLSPLTSGSPNWDMPWGPADGVLTYEKRDEGRGDVVVQNNDVRKALVWKALGQGLNYDVTVMLRIGSNKYYGLGAGPAIRLSGTVNNRTGVFAGFTTEYTDKSVIDLAVWQFVDDVYTLISKYRVYEGTPNIGNLQEICIRLRAVDRNVQAKLWYNTLPEPINWQISEKTTVLSEGGVGLTSYSQPVRFRALDGKRL